MEFFAKEIFKFVLSEQAPLYWIHIEVVLFFCSLSSNQWKEELHICTMGGSCKKGENQMAISCFD